MPWLCDPHRLHRRPQRSPDHEPSKLAPELLIDNVCTHGGRGPNANGDLLRPGSHSGETQAFAPRLMNLSLVNLTPPLRRNRQCRSTADSFFLNLFNRVLPAMWGQQGNVSAMFLAASTGAAFTLALTNTVYKLHATGTCSWRSYVDQTKSANPPWTQR